MIENHGDVLTHFKVYGYTFTFSAIFTKENNFYDSLFAFLVDRAIPKGSRVSFKEKVCKIDNARVATPETVDIYYNTYLWV